MYLFLRILLQFIDAFINWDTFFFFRKETNVKHRILIFYQLELSTEGIKFTWLSRSCEVWTLKLSVKVYIKLN